MSEGSERLRVVVVGAAGQARDTEWLLREINAFQCRFEFVGFAVSDLGKVGERDSSEKILGDFDWLASHQHLFDAFALGIGTPSVRLNLGRLLRESFPDKAWPTLVHPQALFDRSTATMAPGAVISAGVVGSVNLRLDDWALVNLGVTLGHEAHLGPGTVVNHGASISGGVVLQEGVLVGTGARILQYLTVQKNATVGAGAVVTKRVAAGQTVIGVPARPLIKEGKKR